MSRLLMLLAVMPVAAGSYGIAIKDHAAAGVGLGRSRRAIHCPYGQSRLVKRKRHLAHMRRQRRRP